MLDMKFVKENIEAVKKNIENRFMDVDAQAAIKAYDRRNELIKKVDLLRQARNENSAKMKQPLTPQQRKPLIEQGRKIKQELSHLEDDLSRIESELKGLASLIPNMAHPDVPIGKEDKSNLEIKQVGKLPQYSFKAKDHVELGLALDLIDFENAAKVTGPKFYYLKNEAVFLELGLTRYAIDILTKEGFTPMITPDIAREEVLEGIGFNPRGDESNIYTLKDTQSCLVGTAEITLGGYLSNSLIKEDELPIKMAGLSHCFRREAGAAGQYSKGLYRVHQFSKVEMFVVCKPQDSDKIHEQLLAIEEKIFSNLEIPYRVVDTCTGDLGAPAYRKYDLEAWMPGRGEAGDWGEITSTSNCTDYQSRRLNVRYKDENGKNQYLHMLNGTAIAISRAIISVMENFQQEDGSILIPEKLVPYCGFNKIGPKK